MHFASPANNKCQLWLEALGLMPVYLKVNYRFLKKKKKKPLVRSFQF